MAEAPPAFETLAFGEIHGRSNETAVRAPSSRPRKTPSPVNSSLKSRAGWSKRRQAGIASRDSVRSARRRDSCDITKGEGDEAHDIMTAPDHCGTQSRGPALLGRPERLPDPLRRRRYFNVADAEFCQRVDEGIDDDGERRGGAAFAGGADAEGVGWTRHLGQLAIEMRYAVCPRHCVIHERTGDRLGRVALVTGVFHQCLPNPSDDAAKHPPVTDLRSDPPSP